MADGKILYGQQYDQGEDLIVGFTEQMCDLPTAAGFLGDARTEVTPIDRGASRVRVFDAPASLAEYYLSMAGYANLNGKIPDVLEEVGVVWNTTKSNGLSVATGDGFSVGSGPSLSLNLDSRCQSAVNILADVNVKIKTYNASNVPVTNLFFYISGNVTESAVLARATSIMGANVFAFPSFRPTTHTINIRGQEGSVQVNTGIQQHVHLGDTTSYTKGNTRGFSYSNSLTNRTVQIPLTIHGALAITDNSRTDTASAAASVSWPGGTNWPAMSDSIEAVTAVITGLVTPTSLPATGGVFTIPTSGYYLVDLQCQKGSYNMTRVFAQVADFGYFA